MFSASSAWERSWLNVCTSLTSAPELMSGLIPTLIYAFSTYQVTFEVTLISHLPFATAVTVPSASTVAISSSEEENASFSLSWVKS